jgi:Flp pilus assembly protein TadG
MLMIRLRPLAKSRRGVAAVEFALTLPIIIIVFFGAIELSGAVIAYMKLTNAAQTVADLVAQQKQVSAGSLTDYYTASELVMSPLTGNVGLAVASVTFDATTGAASTDWQQTFGGAQAMSNAATAAKGLGNAGESVIVAQATYTYKSLFSYILKTPISMTERAFARPRLAMCVPLSPPQTSCP